jgi:hypothetical protein
MVSLAPGSLDTYVQRIRQKPGLRNEAELTRFASVAESAPPYRPRGEPLVRR